MRAHLILLGLLVASLSSPGVASETPEALIVINEVLYDPLPGEEEWIELYNAGSEVNVEGITLSDQDGHDYVFPDLLFPSGAYILLRVGPGTDGGFDGGTAVLHMGLSRQILNDDGDDLLLEGYGQVLDFFRYGDGPAVDPPPPQAPWEGSAELAPEGLSLSLQPNGLLDATAEDWKASEPTPGGLNTPPGGGRLLITEAYYNANRDNEYVLIQNSGQLEVDTGGWRLSDGEGDWILPSWTLEPRGTFLVAQNATALLEDSGLQADACVRGCRLLVTTSGSLSLNNEGDEVLLYDRHARLVDAFYYGSATVGEGWEGDTAEVLERGRVAKRLLTEEGPVDTNTSADWEWSRSFRLGQGNRPAALFEDVLVKPISSPTGSLDVLLSILNSSRESIVLSGFTLTNIHIQWALEAALDRGVRVQVGIEGRPPGGMDPEQMDILASLQAKGARILLMGASDDAWRRYAFHHAKYVIVDRSWVVLGSENFSTNGFPPGEEGNRGWGAAVFSVELAAWLWDVSQEDWNASRSDILLLAEGFSSSDPVELPSQNPPSDLIRAHILILLSPDNSLGPEGISHILEEAERSIDVELFYLRLRWRGDENPLLQGLLQAARRGVRVRLLLDGSRYNVEAQEDNDEVAALINELADEEDIPIAARLFRSGERIVKLHNKGLIIDGEGVLVSSINWNYNGAYENREAALFITSGDVARAFQQDFGEDWGQQNEPPLAVIEGPESLAPGQEGVYSALASTDDISVVSYSWDLHGDGTWDGQEPVFTFRPPRPGTYILRLRVQDAEGAVDETEIIVRVAAGGDPPVDPVSSFVGLASGLAAAVWFRKLRTRREPTNKSQLIEKREGQAPDLGGRD
jgi:phosphatidylserine/phosphatidylglycerophosphate/cardiolipin synthase-like enzyme